VSDILVQISEAIIDGNVEDIVDLTEEALDDGNSAEEVLNKGLMAGMDHVGVEFKAGNMFVPEVLRSAKAMQGAMDLLRPLLAEAGVKHTGKLLLGTVKGDLHDIGKNLVGDDGRRRGFRGEGPGQGHHPGPVRRRSRSTSRMSLACRRS
jgi:5-methyltetrahydrofolate--homocysteine methyltransferase